LNGHLLNKIMKNGFYLFDCCFILDKYVMHSACFYLKYETKILIYFFKFEFNMVPLELDILNGNYNPLESMIFPLEEI